MGDKWAELRKTCEALERAKAVEESFCTRTANSQSWPGPPHPRYDEYKAASLALSNAWTDYTDAARKAMPGLLAERDALLANLKELVSQGCAPEWPPAAADAWDKASEKAEALIASAEGA